MDRKKTKVLLTVAVAALLLLGITGLVRFPTIFSRTMTTYPRDYTDDGSFVGVTSCRSIPYIYRSCTTSMVPRESESEQPWQTWRVTAEEAPTDLWTRPPSPRR